jgi:hypothetical protein
MFAKLLKNNETICRNTGAGAVIFRQYNELDSEIMCRIRCCPARTGFTDYAVFCRLRLIRQFFAAAHRFLFAGKRDCIAATRLSACVFACMLRYIYMQNTGLCRVQIGRHDILFEIIK